MKPNGKLSEYDKRLGGYSYMLPVNIHSVSKGFWENQDKYFE